MLRRTALFVDFDNMFTGLRRLGGSYADDFGRNPGRVVDWLRTGTDAAGAFQRRFLVMACYLNPVVYSDYRPFFASAGFRVVDCPSLTQQGKSSADIHLALDAVDALAHPTRYDEFVICSADADFTPLMVRLRAHDRRTTMLATGPYAAAYAAVCDEAIDSSELLDALWSDPAPVVAAAAVEDVERPAATTETGPAEVGQGDVLRAAAAIRAAVAAGVSPVPGATAAGAAVREVPQLKASRWAGTGGFARFVTVHLPELRNHHDGVNDWLFDPRLHEAADIVRPFSSTSILGQVARVTGAPRLTGAQFGTLFTELDAELAENGFDARTTPPAVRDRAADHGGIARSAVSGVIQRLQARGVDLSSGPVAAELLAGAYLDDVLETCANAQMALSAEDRKEVTQWITAAVEGA